LTAVDHPAAGGRPWCRPPAGGGLGWETMGLIFGKNQFWYLVAKFGKLGPKLVMFILEIFVNYSSLTWSNRF
jgi:hypothetical protein